MYVSKNRPLAPHLTVYKIQSTSLTSILQRITGIILFFILFLVFCGCLFIVPRVFLEHNIIDSLIVCYSFYFYFIVSGYCLIITASTYHLFKGVYSLFLDVTK